LKSVVSGGEVSRILLAIKRVLIGNISPKLIILDEIDAGIGGKTADCIAEYIKAIAKLHRVLCITHLAAIAAGAEKPLLPSVNRCGWKERVLLESLTNNQPQGTGKVAFRARIRGDPEACRRINEKA
jgi:DNA repair protein RecN (Recombination protein N)